MGWLTPRCVATCALWTTLAFGNALAQPVEVAKLVSPTGGLKGFFGFSVALSGDAAVIGEPGPWLGSPYASPPGSAHVFRYDGTSWVEEATLQASDGDNGDRFGFWVGLSGEVAVIGALGDDDACPPNPLCDSGAVYVFRYDGTSWVEEAKLLASDAAEGGAFGFRVAVSGDVALVGAFTDDDAGDDAGAVYVFRYDGTSWVEEAKLLASDADAADHFGHAVAAAGEMALVGALSDDDDGSNSGSAYVFRYDGTSWVEEAKLLAPDGDEGDRFGYSVAVSGDAAVVGAVEDENDCVGALCQYGSAYVFRYDGASWVAEAKLIASDSEPFDRLGSSVAIAHDVAVIGAHGDDSLSGSAYVFRHDGTSWLLEAKLLASDRAAGDEFGFAAAVSDDTALIGAFGDDGPCVGDPDCDFGAAYVYSLTSPTCPWPLTTIETAGKGQSSRNNPTVSHAITARIVGGVEAYGPRAHRIEVCDGTRVQVRIEDESSTGTGPTVTELTPGIECTSGDGAGCEVEALTAVQKYKAVSEDGRDKDRIVLIPLP